MAFVLKKYDNTQFVVVAEQVIENKRSPLVLPGEGVKNYGKAVDEDLVWLLENFAGEQPPLKAVRGQLWLRKRSETNADPDVEKDYDGNFYSTLYVYFGPEVGELIDPEDIGAGIAVNTTSRIKNPPDSPLEYKYWFPSSRLSDTDKQWYRDHLDVYTTGEIEALLSANIAADPSKLDVLEGVLLKPGTWTDDNDNLIFDTYTPDNSTSRLGGKVRFEGGYVTPGFTSVYRDLDLRSYDGQLELVNPVNSNNVVFRFETDAGNNGWPTIYSNSNGVNEYHFIHSGMIGDDDPAIDPFNNYYIRKDKSDTISGTNAITTTWSDGNKIAFSSTSGSLEISRSNTIGEIKSNNGNQLDLNFNDVSKLSIKTSTFDFTNNTNKVASLYVKDNNKIGYNDFTKLYLSTNIDGYLEIENSSKPTLEFRSKDTHSWKMTPNNGNMTVDGTAFNNYSFYQTGEKAHIFDGPIIAKDQGVYKEVPLDPPAPPPQMLSAMVAFRGSDARIYHKKNIYSVSKSATGKFKITFNTSDRPSHSWNYSILVSGIDETPNGDEYNLYHRKYKIINRYTSSVTIQVQKTRSKEGWGDDASFRGEIEFEDPNYMCVGFSWE